MFGFLEDAMNNALGIAGDLLDGEVPSRRQVAKLISDGVSVVAIAAAADVAVEVVEGLVDE